MRLSSPTNRRSLSNDFKLQAVKRLRSLSTNTERSLPFFSFTIRVYFSKYKEMYEWPNNKGNPKIVETSLNPRIVRMEISIETKQGESTQLDTSHIVSTLEIEKSPAPSEILDEVLDNMMGEIAYSLIS